MARIVIKNYTSGVLDVRLQRIIKCIPNADRAIWTMAPSTELDGEFDVIGPLEPLARRLSTIEAKFGTKELLKIDGSKTQLVTCKLTAYDPSREDEIASTEYVDSSFVVVRSSEADIISCLKAAFGEAVKS